MGNVKPWDFSVSDNTDGCFILGYKNESVITLRADSFVKPEKLNEIYEAISTPEEWMPGNILQDCEINENGAVVSSINMKCGWLKLDANTLYKLLIHSSSESYYRGIWVFNSQPAIGSQSTAKIYYGKPLSYSERTERYFLPSNECYVCFSAYASATEGATRQETAADSVTEIKETTDKISQDVGLGNFVSDDEYLSYISVYDGMFYGNIGSQVSVDGLSTDYVSRARFSCSAGDAVHVIVRNLNNWVYRYAYFVDSNDVILNSFAAFGTTDDYAVAPDGTSYLLVNCGYDKEGFNEFTSVIKCKKSNVHKAIENAKVESLPFYYDSYLQNKVKQIEGIQKNAGYRADSFLFFTDPHWFYRDGNETFSNFKRTGLLLKYLLEKTDARKVICGGDLIYDGVGQDVMDKSAFYIQENVSSKIRGIGKLYIAQGNHDIYSFGGSGADYSQAAIRNILMRDFEDTIVNNPSDPASTYYYFDNKTQKIRYIVFQSTNNHVDGITDYQLRWVCNDAIKTIESGWRIVAIDHINVGSKLIFGQNNVASCGGLMDVLSAVNSKGSVVIGGENISFSGLQNVSVMAYFSGHEHADNQTFYRGVWCINTNCDAPFSDGCKTSMFYKNAIPRGYNERKIWEANSNSKLKTNEQVVDYVNVDPNNGIVSCVRIGAYYDRKFHTSPIQLSVGSSSTLTTSLSGNVEWHYFDNDTPNDNPTYTVNADGTYTTSWGGMDTSPYFSVSNGVITAVSKGYGVVMAMDANGNKEFWAVVVS